MKNVLFFLVVCLSFFACEKDPTNAKFSCKVDGKSFIADDNLVSVTYTASNNSFYIQASKVQLVNLTGALYGEMKLDFSVTTTNTPIPLNAANTFRWSNNGTQTFRSNGSNPGTLTVTAVDYSAKTISGTFSLTAYNDNATETIVITEGKFNTSW